jgi:ATP-dependent DNA helicase PIF1
MKYSIEQEIAFEKFILKKNVFITGSGGTGKTELISRMFKHAQKHNKSVQVCALTGCAALVLNCKARTIHSWSGIGIAKGTKEEIVSKINNNFYKKKDWKNIDILIIDEVSMMSKKVFEILDAIGKTVRKSPKPFGGIQVVFSGDFYQIPPVGNKTEPDTCQFCFESELWDKTFANEDIINLVQIFRQTDLKFTSVLSEIREGTLNEENVSLLKEYVNRKIPDTLVVKPTKLFPTRNKVEVINSTELKNLDAIENVYEQKFIYDLPTSLTDKKNKGKYTKEDITKELDYICSNLICEKTLILKKGCQVMYIINSQTKTQLCNGSQGIITGFTINKFPIVKFENNIEIPIAPHIWQSENIPGIGISQLPLILAWALSIHKSQGSSLDAAEIDIGSGVFECGQTYVALSRVRSLNGLYLTSFDEKKIKVNDKVTEFYKKIK